MVYKQQKRYNFTVTNMLNERHDIIFISYWLTNLIRSNISKPKQTVSDQSLTLLSAILRAFTQYSSLNIYINAYANFITNNIPNDSRWLPQCYFKLDIAHFMNLSSQWSPLKCLPRKPEKLFSERLAA